MPGQHEVIPSSAFGTYRWEDEPLLRDHPFVWVPKGTQVIERDTGRVIADIMLNPDFEMYWCHRHLHFCRKGWQGE